MQVWKRVLHCQSLGGCQIKRHLNSMKRCWQFLIAAVVIGFSAALRAEEKSTSLLTDLSSATISGYVDTSIVWNPGTGNANPWAANVPKPDPIILPAIK